LHGEHFQDQAVNCLGVGTPEVRNIVFNLVRKNYFGKHCSLIRSFMFGTPHQTKKGMWATRNMVMVGKSEGKRSVGRHKCRRDDDLKIYFQRNRMRGRVLD
jgi:hypothetical protein